MNYKSNTSKVTYSSRIFKELSILIVPVLIGKKRLMLFESQIEREDGTVCGFNQVKSGKCNPTHIVVEDSLLQEGSSLEKHLKPLGNVGGVVVGTLWLSDSIKHRKCMPTEDYKPHLYQCSESPPSKKPKTSCDANPSDIPVEPEPHCSKKFTDQDKFACSQSSSKSFPQEGNKLIIQELQKLADAFRNKGDTWRSHGYAKAISAIQRCGKVLSSYEDAVALPGVGDKIAAKVWEILETKSLRKVLEVCGDEKNRALQLFVDVWGVGPSTAEKWYLNGCRTLEEVKEKMSLTKQQQIGLKHYEDFLERIPRNEVEEVGRIVSSAARALEPLLSTTLVGSYRRGKDSCGDIDVMITKPDHMKSKDLLSQLILSLKTSGLITDDLVSMEKDGNQRKYLGVCRLPGLNRKFRRLDIFVVPKSEEAPALMHYTGSMLFNRSIRLLAAKKGMSLSEHSLHGGVVREGLKILNDGYLVPTPTEESVFKALDLEYRPPEERDH